MKISKFKMATMRSHDPIIMGMSKLHFSHSPTTCTSKHTEIIVIKPLSEFVRHLFFLKKGPAQGVIIGPALKGSRLGYYMYLQ
jgi:hypothetical protein